MSKLYNSKYYHRDLSWLRFNHRVLQEIKDKRNPLYERIKFLAIFSSNLDEFFKVRVSDIRQIKSIEKPLRKKLITKPNKVLAEIKKQVDLQQQEFGDIFLNEIIPDLKSEGIHLINYKDFTLKQKQFAEDYYNTNLKNTLNIQTEKTATKNSLFAENEASYLVTLKNNEEIELVEIPENKPRFIVFPSTSQTHYITFIDDVLKYNLNKENNNNYYALKISRDAELYIEDEFSGNLMQKIIDALPKRKTGQATRALVDASAPTTLLNAIKSTLNLYNTDIILGGIYHNFKDFFSFPNPTKKQLSNSKLEPLQHPLLTQYNSVFNAIDAKDQLIHYPYQSFEPVIKLLEEAATNDEVKTLKITLYRLAKTSRLNTAIAKAAKAGKNVVVFIEAKARFDEDNNLKWGKIFKDNGAKVIYSYPGIKVHSKIIYIEKESKGILTTYSYIGTGNFNEKTATLYTDFGLMTTDKKICKELNRVFLVLQGALIVPKAKKLLVSPFTTRHVFSRLVEKEIEFAKTGKEGLIILKMNSLEDKKMIQLLYKASNAGVKIHLIIRGICCLVPGIKGQSENITITSILDRYLEHGRVYLFGNNGDEKLFIGSADWMTRNLSHRIEVITPILDKDNFKIVKDILQIQLLDNVKARVIDAKQQNKYVTNSKNPTHSQLKTYNYFKNT
ncbi:polyphosphate kinase 1 [Cellulophaga omnivescoria]|uniref:polyphosphate kinase 1 n=1 Tax=Cellulophaga omnivescoria TaxID=1888890 RepID=UPI0022F08376|nr:polyphosphate kinase 1 [Cellulophaga omnivescoria]WBU88065.1 polyphosphate kinase 1 [Cellulophaga omnivescoria]